MTSPHDDFVAPAPVRSGIDRRTLIKAGAWAAPVVVLAAGVPAASASDVTWDLALYGPQMGSSVPMFTADLTQLFYVGDPIGYVVGNAGTTDFPTGPITLILSLDRRVWTINGATYQLDRGQGGAALPLTTNAPAVAGNVATYSWTFSAPVSAGADSFTGIFLRLDAQFDGEYPNDHIDDVEPTSWTLVADGDPNLTNNVVQYSVDTPVAATPFGGVITADFETLTSNGFTTYRATSVTLTSVGPNPIVAGEAVSLRFDPILTSSIAAIANVTIDGQEGPELTFTLQGSGYGQVFLPSGLSTGQVLAFDVTYVDNVGGVLPGNSSVQVGYYPTNRLNSDDERAKGQSYLNMPEITG